MKAQSDDAFGAILNVRVDADEQRSSAGNFSTPSNDDADDVSRRWLVARRRAVAVPIGVGDSCVDVRAVQRDERSTMRAFGEFGQRVLRDSGCVLGVVSEEGGVLWGWWWWWWGRGVG